MAHNYRLGKLNPTFFHKVIFPKLGASRSTIVVGPSEGVDTSAIQIDKDRVLVATSDPLSYLPSIGPADSAFLSIHLLASDLTTSGFSPEYGVFNFDLPREMSDHQFSKYWLAFHSECKNLGIAIIGGHTGRYLGEGDTIIGGGTLLTVGPKARYLTSRMARSGDDLILSKGAAIETTAVLTRSFPRTVRKALGSRAFESAWHYVQKVSTVRDALAAISVGIGDRGVTAMHDTTEGGVIAAVIDLASASGLGGTVSLDGIPVSKETDQLCKLFRINPLVSLGEGSLVIASRPRCTQTVLSKLRSKGIDCAVIGCLSAKLRRLQATRNGRTVSMRYPSIDPYWRAYGMAVRKGWS